ncbi:hypothetical protein ACQKWADRAFT_11835 [Trichoderma austrokoningii]
MESPRSHHISYGGRSSQPVRHPGRQLLDQRRERKVESILATAFYTVDSQGQCQVTLTDADESGLNLRDQTDRGPGRRSSPLLNAQRQTSSGPDSQPCGQHFFLALIPWWPGGPASLGPCHRTLAVYYPLPGFLPGRKLCAQRSTGRTTPAFHPCFVVPSASRPTPSLLAYNIADEERARQASPLWA